MVELLVAAAVVTGVIVAVVGTVRAGREVEVADLLRRQARTLINNAMETQYNSLNYALIQPINNNVQNVNLILQNNNNNNNAAPIQAQMIHNVVNDNQIIQGTNIPVRVVTVSVQWLNPVANQNEIITMQKTISEVAVNLP